MAPDLLLTLGREALWLVVLVSLPPLAASLVVGFAVSFFQATTQLQEPTLAIVPRLGAALLALVLAGPWMASQLCSFSTQLLWAIAEVRL
jgi:flagellar biosynthesis protein FliQ